jgi:hypothetical protein
VRELLGLREHSTGSPVLM